jgi:hypothetical protein
MHCIAAFSSPKLYGSVSQKHSSPNEHTRSSHSSPRQSTPPNQQHLQGVSRLVNPRKNDPEIVARDEDPVESDYLGRLLHVADEALHHRVKRGGEHRKRRRVH